MQKCNAKAEGKGEAARFYWHEVILYEDDQSAADILARAKEVFPKWVSIKHDLDANPETGEQKKPHVHLLLSSPHGRTISAIAKALKVPAHYVEGKNNGQGAMAYLTHSTEQARLDGKHLYPVEALQGPLAGEAAKAAGQATGAASEGAQVVAILDFIQITDPRECISMAELARWAARCGLWASFRRAAVIFKTVMEEHNNRALELRHQDEAKAQAAALAGRVEVDPLRFAKLKARAAETSGARVDMAQLEDIMS